MGTIAIVGCEASGKTVFMSALADCYRPDGESSLCLVPENAAANRFAAFQRRQMRILRQWPPATNPGRTLQLSWTLRDKGQTLAEIEMLEFGGETFRAAFRGDGGETAGKQAVKELLAYLSGADAVIVLVSLKEIFRDDASVSMEEFERDAESLWVTRGLLDFVHRRLPDAGLVIGLTQADRYAQELADGGGAAAVFAARWPTIRAVAPDVPVLPVASVSATDEEGRPAEGFDTTGVLPVMREIARRRYGEPSALVAELAAARTELEAFDASSAPSAYSTRLRKFAAKIESLAAASAMCGESRAKEIDDARQAWTRLREIERELRRNKPRRTNRGQRGRRSGMWSATRLRVALAALIGVGVCALALVWNAMPSTSASTPDDDAPPPKAPSAAETRQQPAQTAGDGCSTQSPEETMRLSTFWMPRDSIESREIWLAEQIAEATLFVQQREAAALAAAKAAAEEARQARINAFSNRYERALNGDVKCTLWIAGQYYTGSELVAKDLALARRFYLEAATGGDAQAQSCLAVMCENGEGGEKDERLAMDWFRRAAEGGAADAMYRMGVYCWEARTQDPAEISRANAWFRKAREAGLSDPSLDQWITTTSP